MIKNRKVTLGFLIASIAVVFSVSLLKPLTLSGIIAAALGLMLWPYIVSLMIKGINRVLKRRFDDGSFFWTFLIVWIVFAASQYIAIINDTEATIGEKGFEYSPTQSAYKVMFSGAPTVKETTSFINGEKITSETAEFMTGNCFQRTELCNIDSVRSSLYNKDQLYEILTQFSDLNGLNYPELTYSENELGKSASLRGYKNISDRNAIYFMKVYVRGTSLFTMTVGCPSEEYPTNEINYFLNSISLKD